MGIWASSDSRIGGYDVKIDSKRLRVSVACGKVGSSGAVISVGAAVDDACLGASVSQERPNMSARGCGAGGAGCRAAGGRDI